VGLLCDKVAIHINDTHPALCISELMHQLMYRYNKTFNEALEMTQAVCNYTNHTVLKESLEEWNQNRMGYLLPRQHKIIERINLDLCTRVRKQYPQDEEKIRRMSIIEGGQVKMAHLAIYGSHKVNGVAKLHTEILKHKIFPDFNKMFPEKFINVTNGVTQRRWIMLANPELGSLITEKIGTGWLVHFQDISKMAQFVEDEEVLKRLIEIKKNNKKKLAAYLHDHSPLRDNKGLPIACQTLLDEEALFDVHIKRFHEYKRQLMNALHVLILYQDLKQDPKASLIKRQVIFAGKAAPGYLMAKNVIIFINVLARFINNDSEISSKLRIIFAENYNVTLAEKLIPAADLSEQISTAGMEASGTGNMKLAMNGAMTIATEDGANIEMHEAIGHEAWPFRFGDSAQENESIWKNDGYHAFDMYIGDPKIKKALDVLKEGSICMNQEEKEACLSLFKELIEIKEGRFPDHYFVLKDLPAYIQAQKKVEALFLQPLEWAKLCLLNLSAMGEFSCDESCHKYAKEVWNLSAQVIDPEELSLVKEEYNQYDRCRIL